jgi:chemotaxis protein CheX
LERIVSNHHGISVESPFLWEVAPQMNVNFLNPFVEAASEVLKAETGLKVSRENLALQSSALTTDDITVLLHLVGQVYGVVMYGMSTQTGLNFVSEIMGQPFTELSSLAQSGVAELGNVITGSATVKLSKSGYESNISPPTMILGQGVQISTLDFPRLVVPLKSDSGVMTVHLALREGQANQENRPEEFVQLTVG